MPPRKINLVEAADRAITKVFDPHVAGDINDFQAKVAKFGEMFEWHAHEKEDEAFLVLRGRIAIDFRDGQWSSARATSSLCRVALNTAHAR
jgi:mannose-6-phosphate isomerase-like protein (cupin superfamily)